MDDLLGYQDTSMRGGRKTALDKMVF